MSALATLLELQGHDVHLDQLRHRRGALAERSTLAALEAEHAAVEASRRNARAERDAIAKEQKRLEDEIATLGAKAAAEDAKLYSGTVTAPKELQALQDEIAGLRRRIAALEDDVLVQMEAAEPLDAALIEHDAAEAALAARLAEVGGALRAAEAVIDAEAAGVQGQRDAAAAAVPPALLTEYESLRRRLGGIAVAKLEGSSCKGCHLQLAAVEVDRIRKLEPDALVHCEECGRLLVR